MIALGLHTGDGIEGMRSIGAVGRPVVVLTDPVWPNRSPTLWPDVDALALWSRACEAIDSLWARRLIVHLGCNTDPRFLAPVPASLPFVRVCWLRYARPSYLGTLMNGADVAYVFGDMKAPTGRVVMPGEKTSVSARGKESDSHPCPRKIEHVRWLVDMFTSPDDLVLDPFAGSGTTGQACIEMGRHFIGWEVDPSYAAAARKRIGRAREQMTIFRDSNPHQPAPGTTP